MEQDKKKVILPWDEYQDLLKDSEALKEAREELKKDCKERGLYVEAKFVVYSGGFFEGPFEDINPHLSIASKDEVLKAAQEEMDKIALQAKYLDGRVKELKEDIDHLKNRNLWERIFNKK
jgi:hypothetical protein